VTVVVVGAGLAGAATAWQLARRGVSDVVVVEREALPGLHASGRNAAMVRQTGLPASIRPLAREGGRAIRGLESVAYRRCGSLILGSRRLRQAAEADAADGLASAWLEPEAVHGRVPLTRGAVFEGAVWGPEDGVVDVAALLRAYLDGAVGAGARLVTGRPVREIRCRGGRVEAVETDAGSVAAEVVVNAAGAWAGEVAALAGALGPRLRPLRRHLFVTGPLPEVDPGWPIVWDEPHGLYLRPEPPGLLLSACDETEQAPGPAPADPRAAEALADKVRRFMPALADVQVARSWAGLRTRTDDGGFVLGRDARVQGFVWCAGLGGHGVTVSAAAGRLAAEAVLGAAPAHDHAPDRARPR
jgi:glycine/D-amino acid oxidase-like deaminating enzyme